MVMSRAVALVVCVACWLSLVQPAAADVVPGSGGWAPAAGAAGDNTIEGFVDQPQAGGSIAVGAPFHVSGWIVDTTAEGWAGIDDVQVLLGTQVLTHANVAGSRPDVAAVTGNGFWANAGFDALIAGGAVPAGAQTLTVLAHTPGRGAWSKQVSVTIGNAAAAAPATGLVLIINAPGVGEDVQANKNGILNGVAYDTRTRPELGTGVDRVQAYLDGPRGQPGSQFLGEATGFSTTWNINWEPTRYDSGERHHVLWVYARSAVTGEEIVQTREINIVH